MNPLTLEAPGASDADVVDPETAWLLPASVCRRWDILALRIEDGVALIASPEDQDPVATDVAWAIVQRRMNVPTEFVAWPRALIRARIDEAFGPVGAPEPPPGPDLEAGRVEEWATALVPDDVCRQFGVLPIVDEDGDVVIAVADPADRLARQIAQRAVHERTGRWPRWEAEPRAAIDRAIHEAFGPPAGPVLPPPAPEVPEPSAIAEPPATEIVEAHPETAELLVEAPVSLEPSAPGPHAPAPSAPAVERLDPLSAALLVPTYVPQAPAEEPPLAPFVPRPDTQRPIGELLVAYGMNTPEQIEWALSVQQRTGSRLGAILTHAGLLHEGHLLAMLARQLDLPLADPHSAGSTPKALALVPSSLVQETRIIPLEISGGVLTVVTADPLDDAGLDRVSRAAGLPLHVTLAMESAVDVEIQRLHADENVYAAVSALHDAEPERSAYKVLSRGQVIFIAVLLFLALVGLILFPIGVAVAFTLLATIFYLTTSIYRVRLIEASLGHDAETPITPADVAALDERSLPVYTILLPMYREAEVVPKLLRSLTKLDYPAAKLDIKLLIEADDEETRDAILTLGLPPQFRMVIVPDALPKTKPKACNYGLIQALGEYVVIYDAEDEPEPDQLKKVVAAFRKLDDPRVKCIQCKLNYFNRGQNLLTAWFTTEYSMWFDLVMPGLDALDVPIPLGGTSNHFVTADLKALGAWDPYNVAEDADLGIRLSRGGYRTAVIDSTTFEEATSEVQNWVRQRSRWVKGYMQTWLVHMRHPIQLSRELGFRRFFSFQLIVGGSFATFLLNPVFWFLTTLWTLSGFGLIQQFFPSYLYYAAGIGLFIGNFLFTYLNAAGAVHRGHHDLVKYALLSPVYWGLMSLAAWKGAIQLITRPHYWEKTLHGQDHA